MKQKGDEWRDHANKPSQKRFIPEHEQMFERLIAKAFAKAMKIRKMVAELNSDFKEDLESIQEYCAENNVGINSDSKQARFYNFDRSIRVVWDKSGYPTFYVATKRINPSSNDYKYVDRNFSELVGETLKSVLENGDVDLIYALADAREYLTGEVEEPEEEQIEAENEPVN